MWVPTEDSLDPIDVSSSDMNEWEKLDFNMEINYLLTCFFFFPQDIMIKKHYTHLLIYTPAQKYGNVLLIQGSSIVPWLNLRC